MGTLRWKKVYVERIPIPKASDIDQGVFVALVDHILLASDSGLSSAGTVALQEEIDQLVYSIYGLTKEQIAMVEASVP